MSNFDEYIELSRRIRNLSFALSDDDSGKFIAKEIVNRDKRYSELLEAYTCVTKVRLILKEIHKWLFFWMVIVACFCVGLLSYRLINRVLETEELTAIVDAVPAILTAFTAFVSTVIVVPMTITKFLFNTQEDDNITSLIQHTQQHDTSSIDMLKERFSKKDGSGAKKPKRSMSELTED